MRSSTKLPENIAIIRYYNIPIVLVYSYYSSIQIGTLVYLELEPRIMYLSASVSKTLSASIN